MNYKKVLEEQIKKGYKPLFERGYIKLPVGSYYTWIHKSWFDKAIKEGILRKNGAGMYVPVRSKLLELKAFDTEYEQWEKDQRKLHQLRVF